MMATVAEQQIFEKVAALLMPHAHERKNFVKQNKIDFVHYTTAENALNILRSRSVFMRNTVCMNDYREFSHGMELLISAFKPESDTKKYFYNAVNECGENIAEDAVKLFNDWLPHNEFNVYVSCLSEHDSSEDQHGRLSMWRAYGRSAAVGVAIILNQTPFWQTSDTLKAYGSPVAYISNDQFIKEITRVTNNIRENCELLKSIPRPQLINAIFFMLIFAAACSKHPGFAEEREWRLIHLPKLTPSNILTRSVESIGGIPQTVFKIPLQDRPEDGLLNIEPKALIKKIIIGPSNFPLPIYEAFVSELSSAGVEDADSKVVISSIPLRT